MVVASYTHGELYLLRKLQRHEPAYKPASARVLVHRSKTPRQTRSTAAGSGVASLALRCDEPTNQLRYGTVWGRRYGKMGQTIWAVAGNRQEDRAA